MPGERYCLFCDCAVELHDDAEHGCMCEDSQGHKKTLRILDDDEYCKCEHTLAEFETDATLSRHAKHKWSK
jgi:hypothetical protein